MISKTLRPQPQRDDEVENTVLSDVSSQARPVSTVAIVDNRWPYGESVAPEGLVIAPESLHGDEKRQCVVDEPLWVGDVHPLAPDPLFRLLWFAVRRNPLTTVLR